MFEDENKAVAEAQSAYLRLMDINDAIAELMGEKENILTKHFEKYGEYEIPFHDENGVKKHFRVYEPEGRFVHNTKFDFGTRVKAQNLYKGEH